MVDWTNVRVHTKEELTELLAEAVIWESKIPMIKEALIAADQEMLVADPEGSYRATPYGFILLEKRVKEDA